MLTCVVILPFHTNVANWCAATLKDCFCTPCLYSVAYKLHSSTASTFRLFECFASSMLHLWHIWSSFLSNCKRHYHGGKCGCLSIPDLQYSANDCCCMHAKCMQPDYTFTNIWCFISLCYTVNAGLQISAAALVTVVPCPLLNYWMHLKKMTPMRGEIRQEVFFFF